MINTAFQITSMFHVFLLDLNHRYKILIYIVVIIYLQLLFYYADVCLAAGAVF